jgi:myo-inositol-1(or 4)-monophosphatase
MKERIDFCTKLIQEAGELLYSAYNLAEQPELVYKSDRSFITPEDKQIEKLIVEKLHLEYPEDGFLGEEGANLDSTSGYTWIIDPIDGTSNFIFRLPIFSCSIALTYKGEVVAGFTYLPILNEPYMVEKGVDFKVNGHKASVSKTTELDKCMTIFSIARKNHLVNINTDLYPIIFNNVGKVRVLGSISYELTQIASGNIDLVVNVGSEMWDVAAGILMVRQAGGKAIDFNGNDWKPGANTLIAGNEIVVNKLVAVIQKELKTSFDY